VKFKAKGNETASEKPRFKIYQDISAVDLSTAGSGVIPQFLKKAEWLESKYFSLFFFWQTIAITIRIHRLGNEFFFIIVSLQI